MNQRSTIDMPCLLSIRAILPHCLLIAIAVGGYYFLATHYLFSNWINAIYIGVKIFVGLQIILGSARCATMPILTLLIGLVLLFVSEVENIALISHSDTWQLILASFVGLIITLLVRW